MCVDFVDLNNAFPKDNYPLLSIDELINGASRKEILSMMDAHSGYIHILMQMPDEDKTFCYKVISFGLKNVDATFQQLVDQVFLHQIEKMS